MVIQNYRNFVWFACAYLMSVALTAQATEYLVPKGMTESFINQKNSDIFIAPGDNYGWLRVDDLSGPKGYVAVQLKSSDGINADQLEYVVLVAKDTAAKAPKGLYSWSDGTVRPGTSNRYATSTFSYNPQKGSFQTKTGIAWDPSKEKFNNPTSLLDGLLKKWGIFVLN